jgi:hypothetical protein
MSISRVKVFSAGEVLLASDLNGEFNNILNNPVDLWSPAGKAPNFNGFPLIIDADGDSEISATVDDRIDIIPGSNTTARFKTVVNAVNGFDFTGSQTLASVLLQSFGTDTNVDINVLPQGVGTTIIGGIGALNPTNIRGNTTIGTAAPVTPNVHTINGRASHQMGTGISYGTLVSIGHVNTTAVGNVGASGPDNLMTFPFQGNSLAASSKGVRMTMWGTTANNANAKTIEAFFGGTLGQFVLTTSIAGRWIIDALILRTGASTQDYMIEAREMQAGSTLAAPKSALNVGTLTESETGGITIGARTTLTTSDNDIVQEGFIVWFIH